MGRSGRSGGRSSGGGGGRSSGGRSGGSHRSGRSGSSGGFSIRTGHSGGHFGHTHYRGGGSFSGCFTFIAVVIVVIIVAVMLAVSSGGKSSITKSTVQREPLPKGSVIETGYYTDNLGWIASSAKLTAGMKSFYSKTGVQPYLYITDTLDGVNNPSDNDMDTFALELYDTIFTDEAHLLVLFWENNDNYKTWYVAGKQAKAVIDTEAADILLDYIDRYYYSDYNEDEFFSKAFNDAGNRIMTVTASPWIPVIIIVAALGIIIVLSRWWKNSKKQKNIEAEQAERILNTPLEMLGSGETGLENKYENKQEE